ncbi:GNAT family N-acetyltransferase [Cytobacillus sp. Hz8]|uniref:GNAT family N-acetyltransferase n=1 Tax=Cytobacillus sp. Hz8 TaxID=3347168 RepID=UPI0035D63E50
MFPVLETERLLLREILEDDAEVLFSILSRKDVTRYYGQEAFQNREQACTLVHLFQKNFNENRGIRWGIERKDTHQLIGTIGLNAFVPKHKRAEIGYEIHSDYWRKGYATEAIFEILSYGFNVLELNRIGAVVFLENQASNQLLKKLGFQKEGILKNYIFQDGDSHDTNVYSMINHSADLFKTE